MTENSQSNQPSPKKPQKTFNYFLLFELGLEFAVMIAVPLIAFVYAGKWLDQKFHTKFIVVIGILSAIALSSYLISKKTKEVINLMK